MSKNVSIFILYHSDVESVEKVKGQRCDQIHKEPGGAVMYADGAAVIHHLTRLTHIGGAEIQNDICKKKRATRENDGFIADKSRKTAENTSLTLEGNKV